ncbi:MAG: DUF2341 domain-containing protein, partial [Bacteroidales bacterium]|nr:DUF2341 domain-containing protein [Bacteroidales bacterium]
MLWGASGAFRACPSGTCNGVLAHCQGKAKSFLAALAILFFFGAGAWGQVNYYSKSTGALNLLATWGQNPDGSGAQPPNFTTANQVFNVRNNAAPTISASWTVSGAGSRVIIGDGTNACVLTVGGARVLTATTIIQNNGTLRVSSTAATPFNGALTVNDGGTYEHARNAGTIPAATWAANSNCNITGVFNLNIGGLNQSFGNFTWNCTSQISDVTIYDLGTVRGDFNLIASYGGASVYSLGLAAGANKTLNILGSLNISGGSLVLAPSSFNAILNISQDLVISGGILNMGSLVSMWAGLATINLTGNFEMSGGTLTETGNNGDHKINFIGNTTHNFIRSNGTIPADANIDFVVFSNNTIVFGENDYVDGLGDFDLQPGATIECANELGLNGSIQTWEHSIDLSASANYIFNGTNAQVTGTRMPTTVHDLTINNAAGVTLSQATQVDGDAELVNGAFNSAFNVTFNGTTTCGSGTMNATAGTAIYNNSALNIFPGTYNNLTKNGASTATLCGNVIINGNLIIAAGTFQPAIHDITVDGYTSVTGTFFDNSNDGTNIFNGAIALASTTGTWNTAAVTTSLHQRFDDNILNDNTTADTSFKAGAARFYNTLTISGNGKYTFYDSVFVIGNSASVRNSANVTIGGSLRTINSSATTQTWENRGTLNYKSPVAPMLYATLDADYSGNTVNYCGVNQNIKDTDYSNLIFNSGTKTLLGNTSVANDLSLLNKTLVDAGGYLLNLTNTTPASLSAYDGTIAGSFRRGLGTTGGYRFPVGTQTTDNTALVTFSGTAPSGTITVSFAEGDAGSAGAFSLDDAGTTIDDYFTDGFWKVQATNSLPDYDLQFNTEGFTSDIINPSTRVLRKTNFDGAWELPGGSHAPLTPPQIGRTGISSDIATGSDTTYFCPGKTYCLRITDQPDDQQVCSGQTAIFSVTATGSGLTYQWQKDGVNIPGATLSSLTISSVDEQDVGQYRCYITSTLCGGVSGYSRPASLVISNPFSSLGYAYEKTITINRSQVGGTSNLYNFPMLISHTDPDLSTVANGGHVRHASGYDIVFLDATGNKLDHEFETYNPANGEIIAWVRIPVLSASQNTNIKVIYGNQFVTATNENPAGVWAAGYAGVWHLGDNSDIQDATNYNNDGSVIGEAVEFSGGRVGEAFEFNISDGDGDDRLSTARNASLEPSANLTVSAWIRRNGDQPAWAKPLWYGVNTPAPWGPYGFQFYDADETNIGFQIGDVSDPKGAYSGIGSIGSNWHYITGTYDRSSQLLRFYLDGQQKGSETGVSAITMYGTYGLSLGGNNDVPAQYFSGYIDEVRISSVTKTAGWIQTEYNNQNSPSGFYSISAEATHSEFSLDVCEDAEYTYSVPHLFTNYNWTVTGDGTIISGNGTNEVTVSWTGATGTISLVVERNAGCSGTSETIVIQNWNPRPTPDIVGKDTVCPGSSGEVYNTVNVSGHTYTWEIFGGTIASGQGTNEITVNWTSGTDSIVIVHEAITATGCSWSDTMEVVIGDFEEPAITCPANVVTTTSADATGNCTTTATLGTP